MLYDLRKLLLEHFELPADGPHGPAHWMRVRTNGLLLAPETGANTTVVELFALFHDVCRQRPGIDPGHGERAASLVEQLYREGHFHVDAQALRQLTLACREHIAGQACEDMTVLTCWDADCLDLPRLGIDPDPAQLHTGAARDPQFMRAARARALERHW